MNNTWNDYISSFLPTLERLQGSNLSDFMSPSSTSGYLEWFDTWSFGVAGFHPVTVANSLLAVYSWLLGAMKGGVDWVRGYLGAVRG